MHTLFCSLKPRLLVLKHFSLKAKVESYLTVFRCDVTIYVSDNTLEAKAEKASSQILPNDGPILFTGRLFCGTFPFLDL